MSKVYDNWERLVGATLKREQLREIALAQSQDSSDFSSSSKSTFSLDDHLPVNIGSRHGYGSVTIDKSVEFSYEELAAATDNFSESNKIAQGRCAPVYYGELRGKKAAIKKMDMHASQEFLSELKVLTRAYHFNMVRLIGYCTEPSLFSVYEYMENGNLNQHLHGHGVALSWSVRVQIALDSARALEYIHEYTVPIYIHRNVTSKTILLDKNFHAKIGGFGLAMHTEMGSSSIHRIKGTFGYMAPEYAQYGDVSPKLDVYAFGIVLFELISAKEAVLKTTEVIDEWKGLVDLFQDALSQENTIDALQELIDPRLGDDYPVNSIHQMAQLAEACTNDIPGPRPSMESIVLALMALE